MLLIDDIFDMGSGYVLNFSDKTFAIFFAEELNIDIDHPRYSQNGTSKAKRLRCLLQTVDPPDVARVLNALWEYREALRQRFGKPESIPNAQGRLLDLIQRIQGTPREATSQKVQPALNRAQISQFLRDLIRLSDIEPQTRGFAFEKFLKQLFDAHQLEAREPFRLTGEQIDGSFVFRDQTYLLEAKWENLKTGAAHLHTFHGKIEQKAAWTRGVFVSNSGFTEDGIIAFGRGKRLICIDGYDLHETLRREIPLQDMLDRKLRRAAETGVPFARVRDLFPE